MVYKVGRQTGTGRRKFGISGSKAISMPQYGPAPMNVSNIPIFPHLCGVDKSAARQSLSSIYNSRACPLPNLRNLGRGFLDSGAG
jgi:hypothetical protein